jgi:hypothetical protein
MKRKLLGTFLILLAVIFTAFTCNKEKLSKNTLVGTWKLIESKEGGSPNPDWHPVGYSYTYTFNSDGTFSSTVNVNCVQGVYILTGDKLTFKFDCEGLSQIGDNSTVIYNFTWKGSDFILTPTTFICDEGCAYKFRKQGK